MEPVTEENFETNLIGLVRINPVIFDKNHKQFHNKQFKYKVWRKIAEYTERSPADCKCRWKHLRETYVKKNKKRADGIKRSTCPYFYSMKFLDKFIMPRKNLPNSTYNYLYGVQEPSRDKIDNEEVEYKEESISNSMSSEEDLEEEVSIINCKRTPSISSTLEESDDPAIEIKQEISTFEPQNDSNHEGSASISSEFEELKKVETELENDTDSLIGLTIASILKEIPSENTDKARADLFQCIFSLKAKYEDKK